MRERARRLCRAWPCLGYSAAEGTDPGVKVQKSEGDRGQVNEVLADVYSRHSSLTGLAKRSGGGGNRKKKEVAQGLTLESWVSLQAIYRAARLILLQKFLNGQKN